VFSEDPDLDSSSQLSLDTPTVAMETEDLSRPRSWSNSSEKLGRFEVWTLDESALVPESENTRLIVDTENIT